VFMDRQLQNDSFYVDDVDDGVHDVNRQLASVKYVENLNYELIRGSEVWKRLPEKDAEGFARVGYRFCREIFSRPDHAVNECCAEHCVPVLHSMLILSACLYQLEEISVVMAQALIAAERLPVIGKMKAQERSYFYCMHIFLAHVLLMDQTVPLRHWHEWIFRGYCTYPCLQSAVLKVMTASKYQLVAKDEDVRAMLFVLRDYRDDDSDSTRDDDSLNSQSPSTPGGSTTCSTTRSSD